MDYLDALELEKQKNDLYEEENAYSECDICGNEIYEGQEYYNFNGDIYCEQCFDEMQSDEKRECKRIAGEEYGY